MNNYRIKEEYLYLFSVSCLVKYGMSVENARIVANHLIKTDKWGIHTHGLKNLFGYIKKAQAGGLSFTNSPIFEFEFPSLALLNANNTSGFISGSIGMEKACEMAEKNGVGMVCVKNSSHFGAGACYASIATDKGFIGIVMSNVDKKMTIPGSKGMVMGHNPFTLSAPSTIFPSVFLDTSSSNSSSLKVLRAKEAGQKIPFDWIYDGNGNPTDDPSKYPDEGGLVPFGKHKGYGIAFFIDILTGVLGGSLNSITDNIPSWCFNLEEPNMVSHTFLAINPSLICKDFSKQIDSLILSVHNLPKANKDSTILVPGEIEWNNYFRNNNGFIELPKDVVDELVNLSDYSNIELKVEQ